MLAASIITNHKCTVTSYRTSAAFSKWLR